MQKKKPSPEFEYFRQAGLKRTSQPNWSEYERGKRLIISDPQKSTRYESWLAALIKFLRV